MPEDSIELNLSDELSGDLDDVLVDVIADDGMTNVEVATANSEASVEVVEGDVSVSFASDTTSASASRTPGETVVAVNETRTSVTNDDGLIAVAVSVADPDSSDAEAGTTVKTTTESTAEGVYFLLEAEETTVAVTSEAGTTKVPVTAGDVDVTTAVDAERFDFSFEAPNTTATATSEDGETIVEVNGETVVTVEVGETVGVNTNAAEVTVGDGVDVLTGAATVGIEEGSPDVLVNYQGGSAQVSTDSGETDVDVSWGNGDVDLEVSEENLALGVNTRGSSVGLDINNDDDTFALALNVGKRFGFSFSFGKR